MVIINDGKGLRIEASYTVAATLTEAIRKGVQGYERECDSEHAEHALALIDALMNYQIIK